MIVFNDLRFTDDVLNLLINCEIEDPAEHYDMYISKIYLEYYKNRTALGTPSSKSKIVWEAQDTSTQQVNTTVSSGVLDYVDNGVDTFKDGLFYVIVVCGSTDDEELLTYDTGAVLDWNAVYQKGMAAVSKFASSCASNCEPPMFLEQFVIVWHALMLAIEAKDIDMVDRLWTRFISLSGSGSGRTCNCN